MTPNDSNLPPGGAATTPLSEDILREVLRQVVDPELDCNIVDLGLIYAIAIDDGSVTIKMTLTTPGCPMHESIAWGVENALRQVDGIRSVKVEIVWDPPWHPGLMSDFARAHLGVV